MNAIVNTPPESSAEVAIQQSEAALDLFFKIQEKVNARSEEISKIYKENLLIEISDIDELHQKTIQSIKSLKPAKNTIGFRIAISHNEGESEKFNSFEDFKKHNKTSPNPTSDIAIKYSFTLFDLESKSFENFNILIQIRSRVAELSQLEKETPPFVSKAILSSILTTTAKITIQYEDYVKARHITAMFDEWVRGCNESKSIKLINQIKKHSYLIPHFGKLIIYALLAYLTSNAIDLNIIENGLTTKFIVIYAAAFIIIGGIAELPLKKIESSIDGYLPLSYININKGDAKIISDYEGRNKSAITWAFLALASTIAIGIFTNFIYDIVKWIILK